MITSTITAEFEADLQTVWDIVVDLEHYAWRSDLSKLVVKDETHFTEYAKSGFPTEFTITKKEPCREYCFDMRNHNMTGKWIGLFSATASGGTPIVFTEELEIKNQAMKLLAKFVKPFHKMQLSYVEDLRKTLRQR